MKEKTNYKECSIAELQEGDTIKCSMISSEPEVVAGINTTEGFVVLKCGIIWYGINGRFVKRVNLN